MSHFKNNLLKLCKEKNWSLARLSERSGVPVGTIHGWSAGKGKEPRLSHLQKVADALEVPFYELVFGKNDPHEKASGEILKELFSGDIRVTLHKIERKK